MPDTPVRIDNDDNETLLNKHKKVNYLITEKEAAACAKELETTDSLAVIAQEVLFIRFAIETAQAGIIATYPVLTALRKQKERVNVLVQSNDRDLVLDGIDDVLYKIKQAGIDRTQKIHDRMKNLRTIALQIERGPINPNELIKMQDTLQYEKQWFYTYYDKKDRDHLLDTIDEFIAYITHYMHFQEADELRWRHVHKIVSMHFAPQGPHPLYHHPINIIHGK